MAQVTPAAVLAQCQTIIKPDKDDFEAWCEHPVTLYVARALLNANQDARELYRQDCEEVVYPDALKVVWRAKTQGHVEGRAELLNSTLEDWAKYNG